MQHSYFKKALVLALSIFFSFSASSQESQLFTSISTDVNKTNWNSLFSASNSSHEEIIGQDSIPIKIVYFGSSVPHGQGATNLKGYTSLFSDILKNRISSSGNLWQTANIS